jgi:uncharacterized protein YcnI
VIRRALLATVALALLPAAPASAHIQVRPGLAAPGDPVLFQVIVPNEKDAHTTEVVLQIPKDVLPFSFQDPAGWERTNKLGSDGSVETVTWKGELAEDGFAEFQFLASTPEQEGEIVWKALQAYDDGSTARWIGEPDSDNPAAVTKVTKSAARQNAGGEGADAAAATPAPENTARPADIAPPVEDGDSPLPLILSIAALAVAAAALVKAFR